ncbi:MAG: glycosyltransferase [Dehalococcoidia bacterium]
MDAVDARDVTSDAGKAGLSASGVVADVLPGPALSIVVPAYNEEAYLPSCLAHIASAVATEPAGSVEVIVVDNASSDGTSMVAAGFPGVRVVSEPAKGLTRARERGIEEARGEIVAYVDADTRMPEGWIGRVAEEFRGASDVVCVSGPYVYFDQSPVARFLVWLYWRLLAYPSYLVTGYMAVGGNFAVRRDAVAEIGGFDETIEFYGEDTDIARRLHRVGRVRFVLSLAMPTSARRFHQEGFFRTAGRYASNFLSEVVLGRPLTGSYTDVRRAPGSVDPEPEGSERAVAGLATRYRRTGAHSRADAGMAVAIVTFVTGLVISFFAADYATERASSPVTDLVLSNVRVMDVDVLFAGGTVLVCVLAALVLWLYPERTAFALASLGLFYIVRSVFISLTHIGPFPTAVAPGFGGPVGRFLFSGADLFFSGHTGAPFLLSLMFWDRGWVRYTFLASSLAMAVIVLLGHLHYSIDVLAAFFITYTIFKMSESLFGRQLTWARLAEAAPAVDAARESGERVR